MEDTATEAKIKAFLPTIRSGILMLVARRSAEELLRPEGKEALATDILNLTREETGFTERRGYSPVQKVLFSSLIVQ